MPRRGGLKRICPPLLLTLALLLLWEGLVRWREIPNWLMPPPSQVLVSLAESRGLLLWHGSYTALETLLGFGAAIALALLLAIPLDRVKWLKRAVYPLLVLSQTIPLMVLAVVFVICFGFGMLPKVLIVILVCFFPMLISLLNGLNACDPDLIALFRSMNATEGKLYRMVKLPAALPSFFAGARIAAAYSVMAAILGEWLGATRGLGYFITLSQKSYQMDQLLAAVLLVCLFSFLLVKAVDAAEYAALPWRRG
ncbi:MAG: ABC transporter permease [Syntrophomonadaceae bacterium]|nr:ABC transporter permease [Syntrophomonadaceae bacterium]